MANYTIKDDVVLDDKQLDNPRLGSNCKRCGKYKPTSAKFDLCLTCAVNNGMYAAPGGGNPYLRGDK